MEKMNFKKIIIVINRKNKFRKEKLKCNKIQKKTMQIKIIKAIQLTKIEKKKPKRIKKFQKWTCYHFKH